MPASSVPHLSSSVGTTAFASLAALGSGNSKKPSPAPGHSPAITNCPSQEMPRAAKLWHEWGGLGCFPLSREQSCLPPVTRQRNGRWPQRRLALAFGRVSSKRYQTPEYRSTATAPEETVVSPDKPRHRLGINHNSDRASVCYADTGLGLSPTSRQSKPS